MVSRQEIFAQAAMRLRHDFNELSVVPHKGAKGTEAENIIRQFLSDHLPKRFGVGAGFIIDRKDHVSKQTDLIIYDAFNCPVYRASEQAGIFPSDNVAAVVEVKSTVDKAKLAEAAENIAAVKSLYKSKPIDIGRAQTSQTYGCVFAFQSAGAIPTLLEHYAESVRQHNVGRHIDLLVVLDAAIYTMVSRVPGIPGWHVIFLEGFGGNRAEGSHIGAASIEYGDATLDAFLRLLLGHLIPLRWIVDHRGFEVRANSLMNVHYILSLTNEADPVERERKLKKYEQEVAEEFARSPLRGS